MSEGRRCSQTPETTPGLFDKFTKGAELVLPVGELVKNQDRPWADVLLQKVQYLDGRGVEIGVQVHHEPIVIGHLKLRKRLGKPSAVEADARVVDLGQRPANVKVGGLHRIIPVFGQPFETIETVELGLRVPEKLGPRSDAPTLEHTKLEVEDLLLSDRASHLFPKELPRREAVRRTHPVYPQPAPGLQVVEGRVHPVDVTRAERLPHPGQAVLKEVHARSNPLANLPAHGCARITRSAPQQCEGEFQAFPVAPNSVCAPIERAGRQLQRPRFGLAPEGRVPRAQRRWLKKPLEEPFPRDVPSRQPMHSLRAPVPAIPKISVKPPSVDATLPYDPRLDRETHRGWVAGIGASAIQAAGAVGRLLGVGLHALSSPPSASAGRTVRRVVIEQIFQAGSQSLTLISLIGAFVGTTISLQALVIAPAMSSEILGGVLAPLVIRELAPLVTAVVVTARTGSATATELGNMSARDEMQALASFGIDPGRYVIWPRVAGITVSVFVLSVYFAVLALLGAWAAVAVVGSGATNLIIGLQAALSAPDLLLFVGKGLSLGLVIALVSCQRGLGDRCTATEVPANTSRAVMHSLLGCAALNAVATAIFYGLVGSPFR